MNFLPKTNWTISDMKSFAFGAPVALLGTAMMLFLIDLGGRASAI